MRACDLEVHIPEEVLKSLNIGQDDVIVIGFPGYESAGNTGNLLPDRNTGSHQGHCGRADRCLGGGAVRLEGFRDATDRIREVFLGRNHRQKRSLSERAVPDLTASRASGRLCLADRVGREVILVNIPFLCDVRIKPLNLLNLGERRECCNGADLCLSAGEHGTSVNPRDQIDLG